MLSANLLILLADPTPDTSTYFIAGYVVIFSIMLLYLLSLYLRKRNLEQDYETLNELEHSGASKDEELPTSTVGTLGK